MTLELRKILRQQQMAALAAAIVSVLNGVLLIARTLLSLSRPVRWLDLVRAFDNNFQVGMIWFAVAILFLLRRHDVQTRLEAGEY